MTRDHTSTTRLLAPAPSGTTIPVRYLGPLIATLFILTTPLRAEAQVATPEAATPNGAQQTTPPAPVPPAAPPTTTPPRSPAPATSPYGTPTQHGYAPVVAPALVVPPEPEARRHLHDGFYLHMSIGFGSLRSTLNGTGARTSSAEFNSVAAQLEVSAGGTPWPGVVLGGRLATITSTAVNVRTNQGKFRQDASFNQVTLQGMTDIYPWPTDGFHLLGALGIGSLSLQPSSLAETYRKPFNLGGAVATVGIGWQGWIARQWSMGGLFTMDGGWYPESSQTFVYGAAPDEKLDKLSGRSFSVIMSFEATLH